MPLEHEFGEVNYDPDTNKQEQMERQLDTIMGLLMLLRLDVDKLKGDTGTSQKLEAGFPISNMQKGDIFTSDGAPNKVTVTRQAIGVNGSVLTARSNSSNGLEWLPTAGGNISIVQATFNLLPRA